MEHRPVGWGPDRRRSGPSKEPLSLSIVATYTHYRGGHPSPPIHMRKKFEVSISSVAARTSNRGVHHRHCHINEPSLSWSRRKKQVRSAWLSGLLVRRPTNVVLLAIVRRQSFRDNGLGRIREGLAHRIGGVRRPAG